MNAISISTVIPVYNEEGYLLETISCLYFFLGSNFNEYEVIVVDDGSKDRTSNILTELQKKYQNLKVITNKKNMGLGYSLKNGFNAATKEVIFYIDCDLPFPPHFLLQAIKELEKSHFVIGRRDAWDNILRKYMSFAYNFMIRKLFRINFADINVGVKVFKRKILQSLNLRSSGSFFSAELALEARRQGFIVSELPCSYRKRIYGTSKLNNIKNIFQALIETVTYLARIKHIGS